jgi:hypothetical protein
MGYGAPAFSQAVAIAWFLAINGHDQASNFAQPAGASSEREPRALLPFFFGIFLGYLVTGATITM